MDGDIVNGPAKPAAAAARVWRAAAGDADRIARLAREYNLPRAAAAVLADRNLPDAGAIRRFLEPALNDLGDPLLLPGMPAAVARIWRAAEAGESIVIFGDYDADGITSVVVLLQVLRALGAAATPCLSNRLQAGYGFTLPALEQCRRLGDPSLIVTVDTGITAVEACAAARCAGMDVIVTDHHEPGATLPAAAAIVNPKLGNDPAARMLAGVGVVFQLCRALAEDGRRAGRPAAAALDLREFLDLVMLGTVADIVPLLADNRILVRHGLSVLNDTRRVGLRALIDCAGLQLPLNVGHVAFGLAPRLNAVGRLRTPAPALELLLTDDAERAQELARELDSANRERQDIESRIFQAAAARIDAAFDPAADFGLVAADDGWHPGVIGIVASRLAARYRRPVVVVAFDADGCGRGSGRGIEECNLLECLRECSGCLDACGGHALAAGLALRRAALPEFQKAFNAAAAARLRGVDLRPVQRVDVWVDLAELDQELLDALDRLRPFGQGCPAPVLAARRLRLAAPARVVGGKHLKLAVTDGRVRQAAIAFGRADTPLPAEGFDLAFQLQQNTWQGVTTLQLSVQDWRPAGD